MHASILVVTSCLLFAQAAPGPGDAPKGAPAAKAAAAPATAAPAKGAPAEGDKAAAPTDAKAGDAKAPADGDAPKEGEADGEAPAAGDSAAAGMFKKMMESGALGLMFRGGIFMWPILILGIITLGVILERYRSLKMLGADSGAIRSDVRDLLQQDRVEEALELCDSQQGPVAAILSTGLRKFYVLRRLGNDPGRIEEQVVKAMDDYSVHIVAALERHLPILATVSSVAPMVGFLGTVAGMVESFDEIVATLGEKNIVEAAAAGISVALLTTAFGLIVGIPAYMAYNYFTGVINEFVLDVEESATELIEVVTLQMALEGHGERAGAPAEAVAT